jgi:hypothetical protein
MIRTHRKRKIRLEDFDLRLPGQICVTDIELESGDVRNPNTCILAISLHDLEILVGKSNPVSYAGWLCKSARKKTFLPLRKYCSYTH